MTGKCCLWIHCNQEVPLCNSHERSCQEAADRESASHCGHSLSDREVLSTAIKI